MDQQDFLTYVDDLYRYAMALARNTADAEDLVQETYARAFKAIGSFRPGSDSKTWLFRILRNIWLNELRRRRTLPTFLDLDASEAYGGILRAFSPDPLALCMALVERDQVRRAIEQLPTRLREIVFLREYEDFSYQEIAGFLGCPLGTVMSRLARARARLRRELVLSCGRTSCETQNDFNTKNPKYTLPASNTRELPISPKQSVAGVYCEE